MTWTKESPALYRLLDDVWTIRRENGFWRVYRGDEECWAGFKRVTSAKHEAEALRREDKLYRPLGDGASDPFEGESL